MDLRTFQAAVKKSSIRVLPLVVLLSSAQVLQGTPFRHGGAPSAAEMRQRNKNWCAHVVRKNVSCAVVAGSESFAQPEFLPCPPEMIDCAPRVIHRTHFRPTYKLDYKTVTELQWRCCPGYQGHDCMEVKSSTKLPERNPENLPPFASRRVPAEPTAHQGDRQGNRPGAAPRLEEEVHRLSRMVLDMQARITDMSSNLRLDFQEDASKMLAVLLDQMRQPASGTRTPDRFSADDVVNRISHLESRSATWDHLEERVNRHDGQIRHLMEEGPAPSSNVNLQGYVDRNIHALRKELTEGMDIKLADLKNSCDYKIMSVRHECEDQEEHYLSLTERMDSKESDLRRQIQELKNELEDSQSGLVPDRLLDEIEGLVNSSAAGQIARTEQGEAFKDLKEKTISMEDSVSDTNRQTPNVLQNEAGAQSGSFSTLEDRMDLGLCKANLTVLEQNQRNAQEKLQDMEGRLQATEELRGELTVVKSRVEALEGRGCAGVEAGKGARQTKAEGCPKVQKDVADEAKVLQTKTADPITDAGARRPVDAPPTMPSATETGAAGPPARMTLSSKLPKGTHGSLAPVLGFAGAPAAAVKPAEPQPYTLPSVSADAAARRESRKISFSVGLAAPPVGGQTGVVRFDAVLVNDGGHYDPRTGVFTAPVDGRYLLSAALSAQPGAEMEAVLSVDRRVVRRLGSAGKARPGPCASASLALVVPMRRGQRAALTLTAGKLAADSARIPSSFSGVLLYPSSR